MKLKLLILLLFLPTILQAENRTKTAFIFYYAWYASVDHDGAWAHWQDNNHRPPFDISSSYYPRLGPYSSRNPEIIQQHMRWISRTGVHVVIYSWWGRDDSTHHIANSVLDAADESGLKVSFLIEPYPGRTPRRICDDIDFLEHRFGKHPALFKIPTSDVGTSPARSMYFIYDPDYHDSDLRNMIRNLHGSSENPIVLLQSTDAAMIERTGADGIFAYEAYQPIEAFYAGIVAAVQKRGAIFIPCVSPGFNINRTFGENSPVQRLRRKGKTYDEWWEKVLASNSDYVSVISFNEWHEGTQIEPAMKLSMPVMGYLNYEGAYGKIDMEAEKSYLRRTARWIQLFLQN